MAKQGMKRYGDNLQHSKKDKIAVPEIQGKAKSGKEHVRPIITGTYAPSQKVFHTTPFSASAHFAEEKPIADVYKEIDNDLARDNLENDITAADLQDL